jgi:hypothetical protein
LRHYTFEDSAAVSDLKYWGYHKGKQCAADGYSPENTLAQLLSGRSDFGGHRILCLDMPIKAWEINFRVMELPTDYIAVLTARYCLPVKAENGQPYEAHELAHVLGIAVTTYKYRLTQAKRYYRRLMFGAEVVELYPQVAV